MNASCSSSREIVRTRTPRLGTKETSPSAASRRSASRIGVRETLNCSESCSWRRTVPGSSFTGGMASSITSTMSSLRALGGHAPSVAAPSPARCRRRARGRPARAVSQLAARRSSRSSRSPSSNRSFVLMIVFVISSSWSSRSSASRVRKVSSSSERAKRRRAASPRRRPPRARSRRVRALLVDMARGTPTASLEARDLRQIKTSSIRFSMRPPRRRRPATSRSQTPKPRRSSGAAAGIGSLTATCPGSRAAPPRRARRPRRPLELSAGHRGHRRTPRCRSEQGSDAPPVPVEAVTRLAHLVLAHLGRAVAFASGSLRDGMNPPSRRWRGPTPVARADEQLRIRPHERHGHRHLHAVGQHQSRARNFLIALNM